MNSRIVLKIISSMQFHNNPFLYITFLWVFIMFSSCRYGNEIDRKIEDCYNSNDTIINLSDLFPEEWDTLYYFGDAPYEEIKERLGPESDKISLDFYAGIFIVNKRENVVSYKEWILPNYGQTFEGACFSFPDYESRIIAIPRKQAKFLIRRIDDESFLVIYQGDWPK